MIVRNLRDKAVMETTYLAHGGAIAQMVLDQRILKEIGFLAIATLAPRKEIEAHVDPMEEIYFVLSGSGEMGVDEIVERGHDRELVHRIEHLLYIAEYKRRKSAPGVKITRKNFGRDRRYPITNRFRDRT